MALSYQQAELTIGKGSPRTELVKDLQRDLRRLGYLGRGIDGVFGVGTEAAVRALQIDLLQPAPHAADGAPPFAMAEFNQPGPAVTMVTGVLDQGLTACIAALLDDPRVQWLPAAADPAAENAHALAQILGATGMPAPIPFMLAMLQQESDCQHYNVPAGGNADNFVTIGLDRNDKTNPDRITSRGYGLGQYTIFHHPPRPDEVRDFIFDPVRNVHKAFAELRDKFDNFVAGPTDTADDRTTEHPALPLRLCRYKRDDTRYMSDCRACAREVPAVSIHRGTPAYDGASFGYQPDQYYPSADYNGVPERAAFLCDWPYAARRYNGSGNDSFHYQARILRNLAAGAGTAGD